jgi:hypothetical protein
LPTAGVPAISAVPLVKEQREEQEEMLRRFAPSPVSAILRRAMQQPSQPEIVLVSSDSDAQNPNPIVTDDSD